MTFNPTKDFEFQFKRIEAGRDLVRDYNPDSYTWAVLETDLSTIAQIPRGTAVGQITSNTAVTNAGNLTGDSFAWQTGNIVRITFSGTPDLSTLETLVVTNGGEAILVVAGVDTEVHNGAFRIVNVSDASDYIDIENFKIKNAEKDVASPAGVTGIGAYPTPYTIGQIGKYDDSATDGRELCIGILSGLNGGGDSDGDILVRDQKYTDIETKEERKNTPVVRVYTEAKGGLFESELTGVDANAIADLNGTVIDGILKF